MVHQLGGHYESFQQRKRETGISKTSLDDLISQLHDEELANKSKSTATSLATDHKRPKDKKRKGKANLPAMSKDHDKTTCPRCKRNGNKEDDCWFKHPEKATDGWRERQRELRKSTAEHCWVTLTDAHAAPSYFSSSDRCRTTYDTSSKVNVCNNRDWFTEM
ncbi:hypothetical protein K402DRAFT_398891, partial [Aulographum hederae CBS 113979]